MRDCIKFGLAGFAGYMIGFYECKFKMLNAIWEAAFESNATENRETQ